MIMKRAFSLYLLIALSATVVPAQVLEGNNRYPVVLVGGFMNFGRHGALGFRYWGGLRGYPDLPGRTWIYRLYGGYRAIVE